MEVTRASFDDKCVLVLTEGYQITGETDAGIIIEKPSKSHFIAEKEVGSFCKICKGCASEAEVTDPATIYAKFNL